ncbi:MAG: THUMP domain-containing protein [Methanobacteriota archaeon]
MAAAPHGIVLVRYGELGIKSAPVRARFERALRDNIRAALDREGVSHEIDREWGRVYVRTEATAHATVVLRKVFGIVSVSPAEEIPSDPASVREAALRAADRRLRPGATFAIRARRSGRDDVTSLDIARDVGAAVLSRWKDRGVRVDLDRPDVELHIEVRGEHAFVFDEVLPGPGGLPVGSEGHALTLVESPRSILAAWFVMRRGTACDLLAADADLGRAAVAALAAWVPGVRLLRAPTPPRDLGRAGTRGYLLLAAARLSGPGRYDALVADDDIVGNLALSPIDSWSSLPVLRPLSGLPPVAGAARARDRGLDLVASRGAEGPVPERAAIERILDEALEAAEVVS